MSKARCRSKLPCQSRLLPREIQRAREPTLRFGRMLSGREEFSFNAHYLGEIEVRTSWVTRTHRLVDGSVSLVRAPCPRQAYRQIASKYWRHSLVLNRF